MEMGDLARFSFRSPGLLTLTIVTLVTVADSGALTSRQMSTINTARSKRLLAHRMNCTPTFLAYVRRNVQDEFHLKAPVYVGEQKT